MPHQIPLAKNTSTNKFQELKVDANGKLQVSDSVVNLNTDNLESQLPSALTGSGNLKVCIQELGNEGSERLNTDAIVDGMRGGLPTALTGDGNLKVSIQEDHTHNLALASNQTSMITELTSIKTAVELLDNAVSGNELQVDIVSSALPSGSATSGNQTTMISRLDSIKTAVEIIDNVVSGSEIQADIVSSALPSGASTLAKQNEVITELTSIKTAVEILDNTVSGSELQVDIVSSALPSGASTSANQSTMVSHLSDIKTAVEILDNVVSGSEIQADIVSSALPSGASTSANQSTMVGHLSDIKTAVELLDNAISGSELQVDIVSSALPSGGATSANQSTIAGHLNDIKTAVEILDNTVSGSELQCDIVSSALPSGASTATHQTTIIGHLDGVEGLIGTTNSNLGTIETDIEAVETTCNAILAKNTEILAKNGEIDTSVLAMSAKLPASLGQKANASSLSVCRSTTAGAFDLSARTTIGTASTSTKLLCDAAGHLQVDVLSGASGDPSAPAEIFTNTTNVAVGATFDSSEITLTSGKPVGVLLSTGSFNTTNNIRVLVGTGSDADFALTGSSGSQVQLQTAQIDSSGTYHIAQYLDIPFPKMRLTLINGSGNELTDFICKVFQ